MRGLYWIRGNVALFCLFIAFFLLSGISTFSFSQTVCGDMTVVPTPASGVYNDEIKVQINISNNQCEMSSFGLDFHYETEMFTYVGIETLNCLTSEWSAVDGNEITAGTIRIGGYSGSADPIQTTENGTLVVVVLQVACQYPSCLDGRQSTLSVDSYSDDLVTYEPQPAEGVFTFIHYCGDISIPVDKAGTWGDVVHFPVNVANNDTQICDFTFDFLFDPSLLTFKDAERSSATQDWTTMTWSQIEPGKIRVQGVMGSGTCVAPMSSTTLVTMKALVECAGYTSDTSIPIEIEAYQDGIACMNPRSFQTNFLFTACPRLGDVNGDGSVTPGDAQKAFEIYLGRISPTFCQLTASDANCNCPCDGLEHTVPNNCITPADSQWIFEHFLGKRNLPLCSADFQCGGGSVMALGEDWIPYDQNAEVFALPTIGDSGDRLMVPLMVSHAAGIQYFHLEMFYPQDLLEFVGLLPSPLTQNFEYLTGQEVTPGIVDIEGVGEDMITETESGSLCVVVFYAKNGIHGNASLVLSNLDGDVFRADNESIIFVKPDFYTENENILTLGRGKVREGLFVVPVEVNNAFGMKAFGMELSYSSDKMTYVGVNSTELTREFVDVDGNDIEGAVLRIGGYSKSGIQDTNGGALVELVFQLKESGGEVEIVGVTDDLEEFTLLNSRVSSPPLKKRLRDIHK